MAKKIILKEGNNLVGFPPVGYKFLGLDDEILSLNTEGIISPVGGGVLDDTYNFSGAFLNYPNIKSGFIGYTEPTLEDLQSVANLTNDEKILWGRAVEGAGGAAGSPYESLQFAVTAAQNLIGDIQIELSDATSEHFEWADSIESAIIGLNNLFGIQDSVIEAKLAEGNAAFSEYQSTKQALIATLNSVVNVYQEIMQLGQAV